MITFKRFLSEAPMRQSTYAAVMKRLGDEARIGFEIELFCPRDSHYWTEFTQEDRSVAHVRNLDTMSEYDEYFEMPRSTRSQIERDYGNWLTEKQDEYADEHWEEYDADDEKAGRKAAMRAYSGAADSWTIWHNEEHTDSLAFVQTYELEPKYGWHDDTHVYTSKPQGQDYMAGWRKTAAAMAKDLQQVVKDIVKVNATGYANWNITHDSSIKDNEDVDYESDMNGYGLELVSPPQPPADAMATLERVLHWADKYGFMTNESTGIHVNLSLDDMSNFDPVKLVLFMGDKHILAKFDRTSNTFTKSQLQAIIDGISFKGVLPKTAAEIIQYGKEALKLTAKYYSVNLQHMPKYLEFRAAGGTGYHKRFSDIQEVVGRWLTALEIACDPKAARHEYLKKVMGLINLTPQESAKREAADGSFTEWLRKKEPMFADMVASANELDDHDLRVKTARSLMIEIGQRLINDTLQPTFAWRKEIRAMFSRWGITADDVLQTTNRGDALKLVTVSLKKLKLF